MSELSLDVLSERREINNKINHERPRLKQFVEDIVMPSYDNGSLTSDVKHLIGLAVSVHSDCRDGIVFHVTELVRLGVKSDKFYECLELCIVDGGSLIYPAARHAVKAFEQSTSSR